MTKKWVLIVLGVVAALLLTCVGGVALVGFGVFKAIEAATAPWPVSLQEAHASHKTVLLKAEAFDDRMLPELTRSELEYTSYEGALGRMGAIASRVTDYQKKPAVIWDFGGFGGIFDGYADEGTAYDDQGIRQFLDRGFVVFLPAVRGEHGNPGVFECFYGEVDDLVAAVEHVAQRPDVDPSRIYLMGHSTGGTNVLLASTMTDIPAGVVSFGGAVDMGRVVYLGGGYGVEPYDTASSDEVALRSANRFTKYIRCPVLYIEGGESASLAPRTMARRAEAFGVPFRAVIVPGEDHWTVLRPVKQLLADHIASGRLGLPTDAEVRAVFGASRRP